MKTVTRLFHLDNLRSYLTILVILHHASLAYGGAGDWMIQDPAVDEISPIFLTFFTALNQSYFMTAFFLLAGYFTPNSFEKKGAAGFLRDRFIRLGVPLLIYTTLIHNINRYLFQVPYRGGQFSAVWEYQPGHLWFLQALLLFALIYTGYRFLAARTAQVRFRYYPDRYPPNTTLIASTIVLAVLTFLVRTVFPVGEWFAGLQLGHFSHYIFAFFVGILARRGDWFNRLEMYQAKQWGWVALAGIPLFFIVAIAGGALEGSTDHFLGGLTWQSAVYSVWETVMMIAVITFLLFYFRERVQLSGPLAQFMAASVYTVYIIHQTVLYAFNILFLPVAIPTILKFVLVSLIVVPLCFLLSIPIRKIPGARQVLG
jgi:surface polysaccharide O-acyltransferase-like enzyme